MSMCSVVRFRILPIMMAGCSPFSGAVRIELTTFLAMSCMSFSLNRSSSKAMVLGSSYVPLVKALGPAHPVAMPNRAMAVQMVNFMACLLVEKWG